MLALNFFTRVLLTRVLTPTDYGVLILAQTLVTIGLTLMQYGVPDAVARFVGFFAAEISKAKGIVANALVFALLLVTPVAAVLALGSRWIAVSVYRQPAMALTVALTAAAMPFTTISELVAAAYRGVGQIWVKVALLDIGRALCIAGGVCGLLLLHAGSLNNVAAMYTATAVFTAAVLGIMYLTSRRWQGVSARQPVEPLLRYSLPLIASSIVVWPMTAIPLFLGKSASAEQVAYYGLASVLANFIYMPTGAVDIAALPVWAGHIAGGELGELRRKYVAATHFCLIAGLAIFGPLVVCSSPIVDVLYGVRYEAAARVVTAVSIIFLTNVATGPTQSLLRAFGYTKQVFVAHTVAGGCALILSIVLIPKYGMRGALAALAVSNVVSIALEMLWLRLLQKIHPFDLGYLKILLAAAASLAAAYAVKD